MESTTLNLLTRDGIVTVFIVPALASDDYAAFYDIVRSAETPDELREKLKAASEQWNRTVSFG